MSQTETWTIGRLLTWTTEHFGKSGSQTPRLDAEILLAKARECQRIDLYMAFDEELAEQPRAAFRELVKRRAAGAPVAYLVGHREFYSLDFVVTPDVLIPRPETELVVVAALDRLKEMRQSGEQQVAVADVGTGSGAIAVAVAKSCANCHVTAIDVSPAALAVAKRNAATHGVAERVELVESDLFAALPAERRFAIVASNPPYVSEAEFENLARDVKDHEPRVALVSGPTGTEVIERLVEQSSTRLDSGGWLIMEISPMICQRVELVLGAHRDFTIGPTLRDLAGHPRVVQARRV